MQNFVCQVIADSPGWKITRYGNIPKGLSQDESNKVGFSIVCDADILRVRLMAWELSSSLGFSHRDIVEFVAVTVELARKIYQSRSLGVITLATVAPSQALIVEVQFKGFDPIDNNPELMRVLKLMDEFSITCNQQEGMLVTARKWHSPEIV